MRQERIVAQRRRNERAALRYTRFGLTGELVPLRPINLHVIAVRISQKPPQFARPGWVMVCQVQPWTKHADQVITLRFQRRVGCKNRPRALPLYIRAHPRHEHSDLAFHKLRGFINAEEVARIALELLPVVLRCQPAERNLLAFSKPQLLRHRPVEPVAGAVDLQHLVNDRIKVADLTPHDQRPPMLF